VIDLKTRRKIENLIRRGVGVCEAASKVGVHRNTVRKIADAIGLSCKQKMLKRDQLIAEAYKRGDKVRDIQHSIGVSISVINESLKRSAVERRNKLLSESEKAAIADAYKSGDKVSVIAFQFGVDQTAPMKIAEQFGIKRRKPNGRGKLSKRDEYEIIQEYMFSGKTYAEIASKYGTSIRCISGVLDRNDIEKDRRNKKAAG